MECASVAYNNINKFGYYFYSRSKKTKLDKFHCDIKGYMINRQKLE